MHPRENTKNKKESTEIKTLSEMKDVVRVGEG